MTAGLARIIEICFLPAFPSTSTPQPPKMSMSSTDDDNDSDHTLHEEPLHGKKEKTARAFRHIPPFVCMIIVEILSPTHS